MFNFSKVLALHSTVTLCNPTEYNGNLLLILININNNPWNSDVG